MKKIDRENDYKAFERKILFNAVVIVIGLSALAINQNIKVNRIWEKFYNLEIIGVIEEVNYDVKTHTSVIINGEEFYLGIFGITERNYIRPSDSIYKEQNSSYLSHFKKTKNGYVLYEKFKMKK